jgi:hypothetical protein
MIIFFFISSENSWLAIWLRRAKGSITLSTKESPERQEQVLVAKENIKTD